eukprot:14400263-Alexandrium_andersonii.AAC.1
MSASLVGSEMCIRDRSSSALGLTSSPRAGRGRTFWGLTGRSPGLPDHAPVSYTHLTLPTICSV